MSIAGTPLPLTHLRRILGFVVLCTCVLSALTGATRASAADVIGAGYLERPLIGADGQEYSCATWSGGSDGAGNMYMACYGYIVVVNRRGTLIQSIPLPAGVTTRRDVVPTSRGGYIYFVTGTPIIDLLDPPANYTAVGRIKRMKRNLNGSYSLDTTFVLEPRVLNGKQWSYRNVDVDNRGHIFTTVNALIYEFTSTGAQVSAMGSDGTYLPNGAGGETYSEGLEVGQGIAVSRDGNHIYVVEQRHNHIQRWDRTLLGWNRSDWHVGSYTTTDCAVDNKFASPYDVALDGSGHIYVLDTSCRRIQKYNRVNGAFIGTIWKYTDPAAGTKLFHGFAVNFAGTVLTPEYGKRYVHLPGEVSTLATRCLPDYDMPSVSGVSVPSTVWQRSIYLGITARDTCSKVTAIRLSGAIIPQSWKQYKSSLPLTLTGTDGYKKVVIEVRDVYGRVGTRTITIKLDTSQPPLIARSTINLWGRERQCTSNPLSYISNPGAYRLADSCATMTAIVKSVQRYGSTRVVTVQLTLAQSKQLYTNARKPARMAIISSVAPSAPIRVGYSVLASGALLVHRERSIVSMAPVGFIRGL